MDFLRQKFNIRTSSIGGKSADVLNKRSNGFNGHNISDSQKLVYNEQEMSEELNEMQAKIYPNSLKLLTWHFGKAMRNSIQHLYVD